jgi:hypothetical protein
LSIALAGNATGVPGDVLSPSELLAGAIGSEICIQISDSLTRRRTGIQQETLWKIDGSTVQGSQAAVTNQLRIPSLTPSQIFVGIATGVSEVGCSRFRIPPSRVPATNKESLLL